MAASGNPRVSIIVPARNEEADIEQSLARLLELDYDNYEVIAVNDRSTDRTGEIMDRVAQNQTSALSHDTKQKLRPILRVIHHQELPSGWLGKTHAMWTATNEATGDWLLFTDADVLFKPDSLRRALVYAEAEKADHVVLVSADDHEASGGIHDDCFFPDHVYVRASSVESRGSEDEGPHGGGRFQSGEAKRL